LNEQAQCERARAKVERATYRLRAVVRKLGDKRLFTRGDDIELLVIVVHQAESIELIQREALVSSGRVLLVQRHTQ
jgi:hypothetical protein